MYTGVTVTSLAGIANAAFRFVALPVVQVTGTEVFQRTKLYFEASEAFNVIVAPPAAVAGAAVAVPPVA